MKDLVFYSYLAGLIVFSLILPLAISRLHKNPFVPQFTFAIFVTVLWLADVLWTVTSSSLYVADTFVFETARNGAWFFFLSVLISTQLFQSKYGFLKESKLALCLLIWVSLVFSIEYSGYLLDLSRFYLGIDIRLFAHLSFSIIGLMLIEQLYRSLEKGQRWAVKYLCLGLAAMFAFDFIIYSKSILFDQIDFVLWDTRGLVNALCAPLLAISFSRLQDNARHITVSRVIVVHTSVLFGTGLYMILMSLAGFYIKNFGGSWGGIAQIFFIFLAIIFLVIMFMSGTIRAYIKVYFNKHFFQNKYDYREEWIKLSREIASLDSLEMLCPFVINTLAGLVGSGAGGLWLKNEQGKYYLADEVGLDRKTHLVFSENHSFVQFLQEKQWVIDFCEFKNNPEMYDAVDLSDWQIYENIWLIIPLFQKNKKIAFVALTKPIVMHQINYEDHDLLKTVGMQLANALALSKVTDDLTRARQFEAYNRFSAFLVHDLKNLVAQVSMIVRNAEQHKRNPDFIDDSIDTLENVVSKIDHMLLQLKKGQVKEEVKSLINLPDIFSDIVLQQAGNLPTLSIKNQLKECLVLANKQRLTAILGHLVQNAQDATDKAGTVKICLQCNEKFALIDVCDTGEGMDQKFIAERLFKPFDTTKGNAGMGIGVYEARDYIINQGGEIAVSSQLGLGTVFSIKYPLVKQ